LKTHKATKRHIKKKAATAKVVTGLLLDMENSHSDNEADDEDDLELDDVVDDEDDDLIIHATSYRNRRSIVDEDDSERHDTSVDDDDKSVVHSSSFYNRRFVADEDNREQDNASDDDDDSIVHATFISQAPLSCYCQRRDPRSLLRRQWFF
jgi:hypothetical protein